MAESMPKRSIDDIIGSIRDIVGGERVGAYQAPNGYAVANDDVVLPIDLTDLPSGSRGRPMVSRAVAMEDFAEPVPAPIGFTSERTPVVAEPFFDGEDDFDTSAEDEQSADGLQLAEIAATVERNLEWMNAPAAKARSSDPRDKFEALKAAMDRPKPQPPRPVVQEIVPSVLASDLSQLSVADPAYPVALPAPEVQSEAPELDEAMLRPIIREWLDDNLPPIVERLVREELEAAISGKAKPAPR